MGASGGGGGGGSSGTVDYPMYMKVLHSNLYGQIQDAVHAAQANNPYTGMQPWSPHSMAKNMQAVIDCYDEIVRQFDPLDLWTSLMGQIPATVIGIIDTGPIDEFIDSQKTRLCAGLEQDVIPKYRRGMQNIGAVMTSAFKIGEALLWMKVVDEQIALEKEIKGKLALSAYEYSFKSVGDILQLALHKINFLKEVAHYNIEILRMGYAASKEYQDSKNIYTIERIKWPLEMYKYMMDALGTISSSAGTSYSTSSGGTGINKTQSAIAGALSGAAAGAMVTGGSPIGAGIGGAVGLAASLF